MSTSPIVQDICGLYFIANSLGTVKIETIPMDAVNSAQMALNRQYETQTILENENNRLAQKKALVDNAVQGQIRMATLNDNYRQRNMQYRKLIFLAIITLALFIVIIYIRKNVPFVPDSLLTLLSILLISGFVIYGLMIYKNDIGNRNNVYYNQLNLQPPASFSDVSGAIASAQKSGNLIGALGPICNGASCCAPGTYWSDISLNCFPGEKSGFTTMADTYSNELTPVYNAYTLILSS